MRTLLIAKFSALGLACFSIFNATSRDCYGEPVVLQASPVHLRIGDKREWSSFPIQAEGEKLVLAFEQTPGQPIRTLGLRRIDVKEDWFIAINGNKLTDLFSDENDMREAWDIPSGMCVDGKNELTIESRSTKCDDIQISDVWIDTQPKHAIYHESLQLRAVDVDGQPIACRFTILDEAGSLAVIGTSSNQELAIRSGVVYSLHGMAEIGLRPGIYTVRCNRGFEYSLEEQTVALKSDETNSLDFILKREVDTSGLVACDPHVHTFEVSRHGDASLQERMITLAGEGVELAVATDHNIFVNYRETLSRMPHGLPFTPVIGNEVTTRFGHFNAFAAELHAIPPDHTRDDWQGLLGSTRATPDLRFVILNHPRDTHSNFRPFDPKHLLAATGRRLDGRQLDVDAIELINSAALQTDPMVLFDDWMTQLNRGQRLHAVGSSDSHEVSRKIVGQGRTYIEVDDRNTSAIDVDQAIKAMQQGRLQVSLGLLVDLRVDNVHRHGDVASIDGDSFDFEVNVHGPAWCHAELVELYMNGLLVESMTLEEAQQRTAGRKLQWKKRLAKPMRDVHIVAVARGNGDVGLHWPIAKPYQPTSEDWTPYLFGASGVIRLDCDDDGAWQCSLDYAKRWVDQSQGNFRELLQSLENCDQSVVQFAADQWTIEHGSLREEPLKASWLEAGGVIEQGIRRYLDSERESVLASREN